MENKEKEHKDKKAEMLGKIKSPKIRMLLSDEERMKEAIKNMLPMAVEQAAKKLKRGN